MQKTLFQQQQYLPLVLAVQVTKLNSMFVSVFIHVNAKTFLEHLTR